jgi:hypothetical protein
MTSMVLLPWVAVAGRRGV